MAFGQPSGPPASHRRVQRLLELLNAAGHTDFRDARGPMGFTQRQAGGRFTRDEVEAYIEELEAAETDLDGVTGASDGVPSTDPVGPRTAPTAAEKSARRLPSEVLAAELQRRGWVVMAP